MRCTISLILIPFCLLGQPMPHSHFGLSTAESKGHSERPHIHVCGGHRHDHGSNGHTHTHHSHPRSESPLIPTDRGHEPDHDHDAVYLSNCIYDARFPVVQRTSDAITLIGMWITTSDLGQLRISCDCAIDHRDPYGGVPLYLSIASLRI